MKKIILGTFQSREAAERLLAYLSKDLNVANDDISYIYKGQDGGVKEVKSDEVVSNTPAEGAATGATVGGSLGALAGIATVVGLIPVIGPVFVAGSLITAIGIGGALGTTAAGALTGALAGGVLGALVNLGAPNVEAEEYQSRLQAGDVLVVVHAEDAEVVQNAFASHNASNIHTYTPTL